MTALSILAGCHDEQPLTREELITKIEAGKNVSQVDTSEITDMSGLFKDNKEFNQDISDWNVAHVTNMDLMFYYNDSFDQDLTGWNLGSVNSMDKIFYNAYVVDSATREHFILKHD